MLAALTGFVEVVLTITLKEQLDVPHAFTAVHVTVVDPTGNVLPDAGLHITEGAGVPVTAGVNVTTRLQVDMSEGQVMTGLSLMVTLNEQLEVPQALVAVHVTVVVPVTNVEPEAGTQATTPPCVAVGSTHVAM